MVTVTRQTPQFTYDPSLYITLALLIHYPRPSASHYPSPSPIHYPSYPMLIQSPRLTFLRALFCRNSRGTMNDPLTGLGLGLGPGRQQPHPQQQQRCPGGSRNLQESWRPRHVPPTGGNGIGYHQHAAGWNQAPTTSASGGTSRSGSGAVTASRGVSSSASGATVASQMRRAKALLDVRQRARRTHGASLTAEDLPFRRPGQGQGLGAGARTGGPRTRASSGGNGGADGGGSGNGGGVVRTRPPPSAMQGWIRQAKAVAALEKRRFVRHQPVSQTIITYPLIRPFTNQHYQLTLLARVINMSTHTLSNTLSFFSLATYPLSPPPLSPPPHTVAPLPHCPQVCNGCGRRAARPPGAAAASRLHLLPQQPTVTLTLTVTDMSRSRTRTRSRARPNTSTSTSTASARASARGGPASTAVLRGRVHRGIRTGLRLHPRVGRGRRRQRVSLPRR